MTGSRSRLTASVGVLVGETLWTGDLFGEDADLLADQARRVAALALRGLTAQR